MNMLIKTKELIKKYRKTSAFLIFLLLATTTFFAIRISRDTEEKIVKAEIGTVKQEVSIVGRVKPSQAVDLSFDRSGRIVFLGVKNGDRVGQGQVLAQLDSSELLAQRQRETAGIEAAKIRLDQLIASTNEGPSENLSANILAKALKTAIDSMVDFTDAQYTYFNIYTAEANMISDVKERIMKDICGESGLGRVDSWYFLSLNGGLKARISEAEKNPQSADFDVLINQTREMILKTKSGLELLNAQLSTVSGAKDEIAIIKADINLIISEISNLTNQSKSLVTENYDIRIAEAQLDQAEANLALINAQIAKNSLWAPFSGIVTQVNIERGEIVSGGPAISMISLNRNEIEVNVSEADIAKIKRNNPAIVTFDAYSSDQKFNAVVVNIDPAAKISESIATYRVTLQFTEYDERVLPGLSADMDILTNQKENVLYIPSREIISKDGKKYVKVAVDIDDNDARFANLTEVLSPDSKKIKIYEVEIQTGLKGSDGRTEIVSGLKEGDKILTE